MIHKIITLFIALIITLSACKTKINGKIDKLYFDLNKDTTFVLTNTPDDFQGLFMADIEPFWNVLINNKIYFSIYEHKNKIHFYIKEFGSDSINRFYYSGSRLSLNTAKYDSMEHDDQIIIDIMIDEDMNRLDNMSRSFYNIHELRKQTPQYDFEKYSEKLTEVENIINTMTVFEGFSVDNAQHLNLLKKILFQLRISTLNYDAYLDNTLSSIMLSYNYCKEINNEKDLINFENFLKSDSLYDNRLTSYWRIKNNEYLLQKIPYLKKEINKKGSFILYSKLSDRKLFLYNVSVNSGKIILKEEYINKYYLWEHPIYGIPKPGIRW
jgi:hypothetical protein